MSIPAFQFDNHDLESFTGVVADFGQTRFGYVVTPNTDHLIRLGEDDRLRQTYAHATFVLLDSQFVALSLRLLRGIRLPVCTGSDLTERLLSHIVSSDDSVVLIGASSQQAECLAQRFGLRNLIHHNPPMGFIHDPEAVEECLRFVEAHSPFRYCLLAVGSPQQEIIAEKLAARGRAQGLALCIGASVDFLTGAEKRAPAWMRRFGLEWSYRLLSNPRRLAYRYLVRGPRVLPMLSRYRVSLRTERERSLATNEIVDPDAEPLDAM